MSGKSGQKRVTDRQKIIEWYTDDVQRYRGMIGQETEFGTIVTQKLIDNLEVRIEELKQKEENEVV